MLRNTNALAVFVLVGFFVAYTVIGDPTVLPIQSGAEEIVCNPPSQSPTLEASRNRQHTNSTKSTKKASPYPSTRPTASSAPSPSPSPPSAPTGSNEENVEPVLPPSRGYITGRGSQSYQHEGNKKVRKIVLKHVEDYRNMNNNEKRKLAGKITTELHRDGLHFVAKTTNKETNSVSYKRIDDKEIPDKLMQMLRQSGQNKNAGQQADPAGGTASYQNCAGNPADIHSFQLSESEIREQEDLALSLFPELFPAGEGNRSPTQDGTASGDGTRGVLEEPTAVQPGPSGDATSNQNSAHVSTDEQQQFEQSTTATRKEFRRQNDADSGPDTDEQSESSAAGQPPPVGAASNQNAVVNPADNVEVVKRPHVVEGNRSRTQDGNPPQS